MSLKLSPYPGYKNSGLPWLGEIPAHWELKRIKHVLKEVNRREPCGNEVLLSLTRSRGLIPQSEASEKLPSAEDLSLHKVYKPGELVMNRMQAWAGMFGVARIAGLVSPDYSVFKLAYENRVDFFKTLFMTPLYTEQFAQRSQGIGSGFNRLYTQDFGAIQVASPSPDEQQVIVGFLNRTDKLIGALIRAKQRLIELLNEQRQAIIHRAVTRGLNPNAPTKPTGMNWLPEVPEHWDFVRAKYIFREVDIRSTTGLETHLSMSQKLGLVPNSQIAGRIFVSESYVGAKICEKKDLVLNRLKAHLGVFAVALERGLVSPDYSVFRTMQPTICTRYYELILRTPAYRVEIRRRIKGIVEGFWRLYTDDFYQIPLPMPPLAEQHRIVEQLAVDLSTVEKAIARTYREIELTREYRTRLISDVVTGKLDARGVELPEVDEAKIASGVLEPLEAEDLSEAEEVPVADL